MTHLDRLQADPWADTTAPHGRLMLTILRQGEWYPYGGTVEADATSVAGGVEAMRQCLANLSGRPSFALGLMAHRRKAAIRWLTFAVPACWN